MNVSAVITMFAVVAVLYVVIPVVIATRRHFRTYKLVRCPVLGVGAGVLISRAADSLRMRRFATIASRSREIAVLQPFAETGRGPLCQEQ